MHRGVPPLISPNPSLRPYKELFGAPVDWAQGGIYRRGDLKELTYIQNYGRARDGITSHLLGQLSQSYKEGEYITPVNLFPRSLTDPLSSIRNRFIKFLHQFGETAAIFLSIFLIGQLILKFVGWLYSIFILRSVHGCSPGMCWSIFPSLLLLRQYRSVKKHDERDETRLEQLEQQIEVLLQRIPTGNAEYLRGYQFAASNLYGKLPSVVDQPPEYQKGNNSDSVDGAAGGSKSNIYRPPTPQSIRLEPLLGRNKGVSTNQTK